MWKNQNEVELAEEIGSGNELKSVQKSHEKNMFLDGWVNGWMGGWVGRGKSHLKDCLKQSKILAHGRGQRGRY